MLPPVAESQGFSQIWLAL